MPESTIEKDRTRFWQRRALKHLPEMRAAKAAGLFPKSEGYRNIVEHLLVEPEGIDTLGEILGLAESTRRAMRLAGSLHDVKKRQQIEAYNQLGPQGAREAEKEQVSFLRSRGYSEEVVRLIQSMGGLSPLTLVEDPKADVLKLKENIDLPTLIVHYIDNITLHNRIVPLRERVAYVKKRYKEEDEEGRRTLGRPYSDIQFEVGRLIEEMLAGRLGVDPPEKLPEFINAKIAERIEQEKMERICIEAAQEAFRVHQELGGKGKQETGTTNQFGEKTLLGDLKCEEAVLGVLRRNNIPIKVISEENREATIGEGEPRYLGVLDGIDGTYQYRRKEQDEDRRYGTMFAIFEGTDPQYKDALVAVIMEHPTRKLYYASRGKGAYVVENGKKQPVKTSGLAKPTPDLRIFIDEPYDFNREKFSKYLSGFNPRSTVSMCHFFTDLASGQTDVVCICTRKRNLEVAAAYILIGEAGGATIKLDDGQDLGEEKYLEYGQGKGEYKGIISAATLDLAKAIRQRCQISSG